MEWAYERERDTDWKQAPYIFECLTWIANNRRSESLETRVAVLRSQGEFTLEDANRAAKRLCLGENWQNVEESLIIGTFKSRLQDAPTQEHQMKEDLLMIGSFRHSTAIQEVASQGTADAPFGLNEC